MDGRKRIGIEALLSWTFRDELPKAQAVDGMIVGPKQFGQAWGGMERYGELLTIIDAPENVWGLVPDLTARREPHPDAIRVGEAVAALDELELGLPDDWNPLGDMPVPDGDDLVQAAIGRALASATTLDATGQRRLKATPRWLVTRYAILARAPDWQGEAPALQVESARGKPRWFVRQVLQGEAGPYEVELDGYCSRRKRPMPGAYQKRFLDPDPQDVAVARAEYEVWRAAIDVLAEDLSMLPHVDQDGEPVLDRSGRQVRGLATWRHEASDRPLRPWADEAAAERRILPDLSPPPSAPIRLARTVKAHYAPVAG